MKRIDFQFVCHDSFTGEDAARELRTAADVLARHSDLAKACGPPLVLIYDGNGTPDNPMERGYLQVREAD